jgi:hypothetical protein
MSTDFQGHQPTPAAPAKNTMSLVGLILAFIAPPVGFVLSIIGLSKSKTLQAGKGMAIAGIIVSMLTCGGGIAAGAAVFFVADKVSTALDAGCTDGIDAINDGTAAMEGITDPAAVKAQFEKTIGELDQAAADSKDSEVRDAVKALADDYRKMVEAIDAGDTAAASAVEASESTHIDSLNELCTGSS